MIRQRKVNQTNDVSKDEIATRTNSSSDNMSSNRSHSDKEGPPSKVKVWILASRPHTLTASIVPVLVSAALITHLTSSLPILTTATTTTVTHTTYSHYYLSFCFAIFACLIQLGTNLHNDYSDFIKGADTEKD